MHISTATYYDTTLAGIEGQQGTLSRLTTELATGKRVNVPADDPVAAADALRVNSQAQALTQYSQDNALTSANLALTSQTLDTILALSDEATALTEQAANGTTSTQDRVALTKQAVSLKARLLGLANTRNGNGVYLFAGSRSGTVPFVKDASGTVTYHGDGAQGYLHTSLDQSAVSLVSGAMLTGSASGNGFASASATPGNAGNGTALLSGIVSTGAAKAFRASATPYKITFGTGPTGALQYAVTLGGATVQQGAYEAGVLLDISGIGVTLAGAPKAGDSFTIAPSRPHGLFAALGDLVNALREPTGTPASNALSTQRMNGILADLQQSRTSILSSQSTLGVAMRAINNTNDANASRKIRDASEVDSLTSADIPKVMTAINEHSASLTAAMTAFGKLSDLSLFKYL